MLWALEQPGSIAISNASIENTKIGASKAETVRATTLESTIATGTAPLIVASTTKVSNLNADQVDGGDWASPGAIGTGTPSTGKFTTVESTIATGTAPLIVASTTKVSNLNADQLDGGDWASPGAAIGTGTPVAGTFTDLTSTGNSTLGNASTDTLNVGNGDIIKDASGNTGIGASPPSGTESGSRYFSVGAYANISTVPAVGNSYIQYNLNAIFNGSDAKYIETATAVQYHQTTGQHVFRNAASGSAGATITWLERMRIDLLGNVTIGSAAIATNATDGFLYIPSCAGNPSGTPTTKTGRIALVYDSSNNRLYAYNGAWKFVALS